MTPTAAAGASGARGDTFASEEAEPILCADVVSSVLGALVSVAMPLPRMPGLLVGDTFASEEAGPILCANVVSTMSGLAPLVHIAAAPSCLTPHPHQELPALGALPGTGKRTSRPLQGAAQSKDLLQGRLPYREKPQLHCDLRSSCYPSHLSLQQTPWEAQPELHLNLLM